MYPIGGLRSTLVACVENRSKKGQQAHSPRQRPGYVGQTAYVKERAKALLRVRAFALTGVGCATAFTQGVALSYGLAGLSGHYRVIADNHSDYTDFGRIEPLQTTKDQRESVQPVQSVSKETDAITMTE